MLEIKIVVQVAGENSGKYSGGKILGENSKRKILGENSGENI